MNISLHIRPVLIFFIAISLVVVGEFIPSRKAEARCSRFPLPCRYDPTKEDPPFFAEDDRVNPSDPVAPMTAYCKADHSIDVWGIDNSVGKILFTATEQQIEAALAAAARNGRYVLIQERDGRQLVALAPGDLLLHDYGGYDFRFSAALCGLDISNPAGDIVTAPPANVQPVGQPGTTLRTRGNLKVRFTPSINGDILGYVPSGATISVAGRDVALNWLKVSYNGLQGWVVATHFGLTPEELRNLPIVH